MSGWRNGRLRLLAAGMLALAAASGAGDARAEEQRSPAEIEAIVRDYLLREPEIIMQAIEELQRRRDAQATAQQRERLGASRELLLTDARDPVLGDGLGDVTIVEFFDYRCAYCKAMAAPMRELIEGDPGLRVVMKEFPILGPDSLMASKAALAAELQGGYEAMHWALMDQPRIDEGVIRDLAEAQGLDVERLLADMESEPVLEHLQDNILLAQELGINGTPSFVIGDTVLPGAVPTTRLAALVAELRADQEG